MSISMEEALCIQPAKTTPKQAPITPHPPSAPTKIDVILDLLSERERLKQVREDVATGERKADNNLKTEMYITQLVISANKTIIDALKETSISLTQNNFNQVDISTQVNELIKISREEVCSSKPALSQS